MKRLAPLLAAAVLAGCGGGGEEQRDRPGPGPARPSGEPERHLAALQRIADRSGGTREAGTAGDERTIDYLVRTLRATGWAVRTQPVRFPFFDLRETPRLAGLRHGPDFRVAQYSAAGKVRARARRVRGFGCSAADYTDLRRGELAVADRGECFFTDKAQVAERAGASGLVAVDVHGRTPVAATLVEPGIRIPVVIATGRAARRLVGRTVALEVDAVSERRATRNVIADSRHGGAGDVLMAGGHHDSVTAGPGINDNGSGMAALLAFAERRPDVEGVRLGFWAAEELGLYGSRRYVRSLTEAERRSISVYLNFDMLGSPNGRPLVYDRDDAIERELRRVVPGEEDEVKLTGASDHDPFERAGVPIGGLFTGASEKGRGPGPADPCYHRSCDTADNVDRALLRRMTDAVEEALARLAAPR